MSSGMSHPVPTVADRSGAGIPAAAGPGTQLQGVRQLLTVELISCSLLWVQTWLPWPDPSFHPAVGARPQLGSVSQGRGGR